jgi:hypothetical protein
VNATPEELDRLIKHFRSFPQVSSEIIGGYRREFRSDHCLAADYLQLLRAELPYWQIKNTEGV